VLVEKIPGIEVVAEASDGGKTIAQITRYLSDILPKWTGSCCPHRQRFSGGQGQSPVRHSCRLGIAVKAGSNPAVFWKKSATKVAVGAENACFARNLGYLKGFLCMDESVTSSWWSEVRERIHHSVLNFPQGFEQQTVLNLLADQEALELVCEPFSDLEPSLAVYQALHKLFLS
jgi:hypothetical protein